MFQNFLEKTYTYQCGVSYGLESSNTEAVYKLNTVSKTIDEMSRNYKEDFQAEENLVDAKKVFLTSLEEKLDVLAENILYEDLVDEENGLTSEIFDILEEKNIITKKDILDLLEKRNEYIMGFEDFDTNMKVEDDINKVTRLINETYKIGKLNNLWKQRMKENKKVISTQLDRCFKGNFKCC